MIDKEEYDEYMRVYKELIDRILQKERVIQNLINYASRYARKVYPICVNKKEGNCNYQKCQKCLRDFFDKDYKKRGVSK